MIIPVPVPVGGKAVTKLIEVVSAGIGKLYEPKALIENAKAQAEANLILAEADIHKQELLARAAQRIGYIESGRQENIESIVSKATLQLPDKVSEKPVDRDWTSHFFSSVQDVSSDDLQQLWAKILAGEVANPGSFSRRTLETLKSVSQDEAGQFIRLMSAAFRFSRDYYIIDSDTSVNVMGFFGQGHGSIRHFEDIGLLRPFELTTFDGCTIRFGSKRWFANKSETVDGIVRVRYFTSVGNEIASLIKLERNLEIAQWILKDLERSGITFTPDDE